AATADAPRNQGSASARRCPRRGVARPAAMAALNDKIQSALDEARILVLGTQMLIGFQYRLVLEPAFQRFPELSRWLALASLLLILLTFGLLLAPGSFHRIVEGGEDTERLHAFSMRIMETALAPFAVALGIALFLVGQRIGGTAFGAIYGATATLL